MMDVVKIPDGEFLQLRPCIGGRLLQHLGTGSKVVISSRCVLKVENGNGFLDFKDVENAEDPDWASAWLNSAGLVKHRDQSIYGERDFHILSLADNTVTSRDEVLLRSYKVCVVKCLPAGQSAMYLEAFLSDVA